MSAEVSTGYTYYGYCSECAAGFGDGSEESAEAWVEKHNTEYHEESK